MEYIFKVPESLSNEKLYKIFQDFYNFDLSKLNSKSRFIIDIVDTEYASPGALLLLEAIRDIARERGAATTVRYNSDSRLTKIARALGFIKTPSSIVDSYEKGMSNYSIKIKKVFNRDESGKTPRLFVDHIESRTNCSHNSKVAIDFALAEILENAATHGYECYDSDVFEKGVYICGFSYKDGVQIAVLDRGVGIHKGMAEKHPQIRARDLLEHATKKDISGHPKGSPGFGLYPQELAKAIKCLAKLILSKASLDQALRKL